MIHQIILIGRHLCHPHKR